MSDAPEHWQRWEMGTLERRAGARPAAARGPDPRQQRREEDARRRAIYEQARKEGMEAGRQQGYEEGFNEGRKEGEQQAHAEYADMLAVRLDNTISPISVLVEQFSHGMAHLNDDIGRQLVDLALETGRQLANRALDLSPEHILDDVEDLLANEPTLTGQPRLFVNPDDLELVKNQLSEALSQAGWQLLADHDMQRGDCRIETDFREIDATRSGRWERIRQAVGHGEH